MNDFLALKVVIKTWMMVSNHSIVENHWNQWLPEHKTIEKTSDLYGGPYLGLPNRSIPLWGGGNDDGDGNYDVVLHDSVPNHCTMVTVFGENH